MQNPGYDAWGVCGLVILAICLIWLGIYKLRGNFQKPKRIKGCDYKGDVIRVLSEEDIKKYAGQHVCTISFSDHTVVSANKDEAIARQEAANKGYPNAVCFPVSRPFDKFAFLETSEAITIR